ncbi:uncharacterized protein LOC119665934 [Teleopsis dalmanni]|uniref:uncharacterized protein LOC119665934 n=1 Tax=Teleopsis dalmanni TaxID=139649 RepID=UPI0018CD0C1E|nr:uncharacterized protein LOC119665934 [Teleopsis dalmanni]
MDYQFVFVVQILISFVFNLVNPVNGIVGRELLLTPKQDLEVNGKSIYYEEDTDAIRRNQTTRPWERTLKHVTFVTLFTNTATNDLVRNSSKLKEYAEFLRSPYITQKSDNDYRFGDIVTLASGRLEEIENGTFRFVEGVCDYDCNSEKFFALWQVQKIRHRDTSRNFRYEIKFSVSPMRNTKLSSSRRKDDDQNLHNNNLKSFIQKEDDYPQNFGRIIYPEETSFTERSFDENTNRNFRQVTLHDYRTVNQLPQSTFLHSIYQPYPKPLSYFDRLNIGEFIKTSPSKGATKVELYPNVMNIPTNERSNYLIPTTFRPNYQLKLPKPEYYKTPQEISESKVTQSLITHHYHHHFYMPGSLAEENNANSVRNSANFFKNEIDNTVPQYLHNLYEVLTQNPKQTEPTQIIPVQAQQLAHVTRVPTKQNSQILQMVPINIGAKVPLLIYPVTLGEDHTTQGDKPFKQSEPLDKITNRYSEPDPLYINLNEHDKELQYYELNASQLEPPSTTGYLDISGDQEQLNTDLQIKNKKANIKPFRKILDAEVSNAPHVEESKKNVKPIVNKELEESTKMSERRSSQTKELAANKGLETKYNTNTTEHTNELIEITSAIIEKSDSKYKQDQKLISSSTTETPLRTISHKPFLHITTTEKSMGKWKPKRRSNFSSKYTPKLQSDNISENSELKNQIKVSIEKPLANISLPKADLQNGKEIFEVLTQKSVSKSVSIKVGNNGEEIPVIVDDNENEVKKN